MTFFPSLPPNAGIGELFTLNPELRKAMTELGRVIMRGESPLTPAQRETIAAYVSALNKCAYCYNGHSQMAVNLGVARATLDRIVDDVDGAPVDEAFKPILRYVRKLTLTPDAMTQADADAVYAAGWSERALHDAILVCCRFNFMNRLSLGHGLDPAAETAEHRAQKMSYAQPAAPER
ncbi:MAG: carboxymuconolactone decarboxylase family protein [Gemmatimonas sp.]